MHRYLPVALGLLVLLGLKTEPAAASGPSDPGLPRARTANARYVCIPDLVWRNPELCPSHGPATTAYRIASIRLPDPLPELQAVELPHDKDDRLVPRTYAHVTSVPLNVYRHPMEAAMGLPPARTMLSGDWWVSVDALVQYEDQQWYQINEEEFVPADALAFASPSHFQGVYLTEQPQFPFAWINRWVQPSVAPQGALNQAVAPLQRYQRVTLFTAERRGGEIWYLISPNQWVEQRNVSRVDVDPLPEGVRLDGKWIEVDLFEQTIAAYEGQRMVYATLISSGRTATATPPGLYRVYFKLREGKMSNPDVEDGSPTWYYIEDVPWTMYFLEGYSIHAAFWHDAFGFQRSHGCVNLPPRDAQWFFNWADPFIAQDVEVAYAGKDAPTTLVWVHFASPFD